MPAFLMTSTEDLHQVLFQWPHTEPTVVIVTGTFDEWASSIRLVKKPTGFEAVAQVPWEQKIKYKFVVDGEWLVHENQPTEVDPGGFVNNVYTSPPKPITPPALEIPLEPEEPTAVKTNNYKTNDDNVVVEVTENTPQNTQSLTGTTDGKIAGAEPRTSDASGFLSDLASTIVARDGTSSALAYVASGLGAAIHSAVGVDPINISKIAISTPKYNDDSTLPPGMDTPPIMGQSAPQSHILPQFDTEVVPVSNVAPTVETPPKEKTNGPSPGSAVVNTPHMFESAVEESTAADATVTLVKLEAPTERTIESSTPPPVINTLLTSETTIALANAEATPAKLEVPADEPSAGQASKYQDQHEDLQVSTSIPITPEPYLDITRALGTGVVETTLVSSSPVAGPIDEVKLKEDLFPESKEENSGNKSIGDAIVETAVEPNPSAAIGASVDVAEPETKIIVEAKPEDSSVREPTEANSMLEDSPTERTVAESVAERTSFPVIEVPVDVVQPTETATIPLTTASSVTSTVTEVPAFSDPTPRIPAVLVEDLTADSELVDPKVILPAEPNPVTEEKAQTPSSVPEIEDVQTNLSNTAVVTERAVAEPIATPKITQDSGALSTNDHFTPTVPTTPRKEALMTGSVQGIQDYPWSQTDSPDSPSQTADDSPSSSRFNSLRRKRTSLFGKIKNIFHHDKEKGRN